MSEEVERFDEGAGEIFVAVVRIGDSSSPRRVMGVWKLGETTPGGLRGEREQ